MRRTFQVTVVDPNYVCVWISGTVSEILKDQLNLVRAFFVTCIRTCQYRHNT
jgi:hypothetical protein